MIVLLGALVLAIWAYFMRRGVKYDPKKEAGPIGYGVMGAIVGAIIGGITTWVLGIYGIQVNVTTIFMWAIRPLLGLGRWVIMAIILILVIISFGSLVNKRVWSILGAFVLAVLFLFNIQAGFQEIARLEPTATPTATPVPTHTPTATPIPKAIVNPEVNLRTGPGTVHSVVAKLKKGEMLEIIARNRGRDWLRVRRQGNGETGWVSAEFVEAGVSSDDKAVPIAIVNPEVNLRVCPSTDTSVAAELKQGEELEIIGYDQDKNWLHVRRQDSCETGWVSAGLVAVIDSDRPNGVVKKAVLDLRAGPSSDNATLGVLKQGEVLEIIGHNPGEDWLEVRRLSNDETGWVPADFVDIVGSVDYEAEIAKADGQDKARLYYIWASQLRREGEYDAAIEKYNTIISDSPLSSYAAWALLNIGNVYQGQGRPEDAEKVYRTALKADANLVEAINNLGVLFYTQNKVDDAIEQFQQAVATEPNHPDAYINLGVVYGEQGQLEKAIQQFQKALAINPNNAKAHYNLGWIYDEQGRLNEAVDEYKKAIEIKPDYAKAHTALTVTYSKLESRQMKRSEPPSVPEKQR